MSERFTVERRDEQSRYVLLDAEAEGARIGQEQYVDADGERIMYHTDVSEDYAGQGLAGTLVAAAVNDTIEAGLKIVPVCPYVKAWLPKHPEYAEHVVEPTPAHLRAITEARRRG